MQYPDPHIPCNCNVPCPAVSNVLQSNSRFKPLILTGKSSQVKYFLEPHTNENGVTENFGHPAISCFCSYRRRETTPRSPVISSIIIPRPAVDVLGMGAGVAVAAGVGVAVGRIWTFI